MCFGKPKKPKAPKIQTAAIPQTQPIVDQPGKIQSGSEAAQVESNQRKRTTNPNLSLFQIQLLPGVTSNVEDSPGAAGGI